MNKKINIALKENSIKKLGGYKAGNLYLFPGIYGKKILDLMKKKNFFKYLGNIINDDFSKYNMKLGGNINLPKSNSQIFHKDGNWNPRMIIINIASINITEDNGPIEICEKSHIKKYSFWRFFINSASIKKKKVFLKQGEILIREHRLWHRGTINNSKKFREMIAIMFVKKIKEKKIKKANKIPNDISIKLNMFDNKFKGRLKEFIFIYLKPIYILLYCLNIMRH